MADSVDTISASNIALTPLGTAYCEGQSRQFIEAEIERLIEMLDTADDDPDLEPTLGAPEAKVGGYVPPMANIPGDQTNWADGTALDGENEPIEDDEPSLAGPGQYLNGRMEYDLELVNEDGGDVLDEPHDAEEDCGDSVDEPVFPYKARRDRQAARALLARLPQRRSPRDPDELTIIRPGVARVG